MGNKLDEFLSAIKIGELMHRKPEKKRNPIICILAVIGAIAAVAAIAYAVYRYLNPNYLDDFDDDFDEYEDDFDDEDDYEDDEADVVETEQDDTTEE
ncbi:hypothetical protein DFR55_10392 [Herbinix hemicellulosilytica]|mgnify:CR=1 FL=1|uniref:DUF4366 domain-containing protein n=1 Tax=Herbinix hemicellulosilytica TaxID=1564487 RepID=A0A0H5SEG8_HERHM|nr:DUF4366 domain-containing protein [Herbinix hemicellulosilytica]RBP60108.1 hypothetical protein DFR55_10392 [Herbinix hemicellulosilytica]CRZ33832.1 hypothetical protein HHT355_0628 [Herbinix hemicellulosilytica]